MMTSALCVVCEKTGHWAAALRWHSGSRRIPLRETRSLIAARAALLQAPTSILVLETTAANAEGVLRLILEVRRTCPKSRTIVLLMSETKALQHRFWEAGAAFVALSARRLDRIVRLVERHLELQEPPLLTTRERVWTRMPWNVEAP